MKKLKSFIFVSFFTLLTAGPIMLAMIYTYCNQVDAKCEHDKTINTVETGELSYNVDYQIIQDDTTGIRYLITTKTGSAYGENPAIDIQVLYDDVFRRVVK